MQRGSFGPTPTRVTRLGLRSEERRQVGRRIQNDRSRAERHLKRGEPERPNCTRIRLSRSFLRLEIHIQGLSLNRSGSTRFEAITQALIVHGLPTGKLTEEFITVEA